MENPLAASVIFAQGEVGRVDDPALAPSAHRDLQAAANSSGTKAASMPDEEELR